MLNGFLPISKDDMLQRGWQEVDFVFVIGDSYVDHPSFGPAIISRVLEANGYRVGIIAMPDWKKDESVQVFGVPRLGFLVSGGNMDSMVNHYTVAKKRRSKDAYTPGGVIGKRPDRATIVYCNLIRKVYKNIPVIIGGIEASLRRLAHYDYWSDSVKRSILLDSQADLISYGMGEHSIVEIADALQNGIEIKDITFINGTVYKTKDCLSVYDGVQLPSFQDILADKREFAKSFMMQYENTDSITGKRLIEKYKDTEYVVQNPPSEPLTTEELDNIYAFPYMRAYHPSYEKEGGIPVIEELKFSLAHNRGCFGGCSFCALTFHQGRRIQSRSHESILKEASSMILEKDFKGNIYDVGGPTANFRRAACEKQLTKGVCTKKQCLHPKPCSNLIIDHQDYRSLLNKLQKLPKVKKVFIRSGIRYDYLIQDKDDSFFYDLCKNHVSGQLKVAPEHVSDKVLSLMGKPGREVYDKFTNKYTKVNQKLGLKQFVVPYLMSSHPGSTMKEAVILAEYIRDLGYMPEQVQDYYPTPSTISTCMYYTGLNPRTMEPVYVPRSPHEKAMQRALIQYRDPKNYNLIVEALTIAKRTDLIGFGKTCLIRPRTNKNYTENDSSNKNNDSSSKKNDRSSSNKGSNKRNDRSSSTNEGSIKKNDRSSKNKDRSNKNLEHNLQKNKKAGRNVRKKKR